MAKTVDIARNNLKNLTNPQTKTKLNKTVDEAKAYVLQLDEEADFPKIGLLIDRADIINSTLKIGIWSLAKQKKQFFVSAAFLAVQYFLIKKRC